MNHPTSAKNVSGQSGRSWQTRTPTSQHATSRSLTTSPGSTRRMLLEEESKGKEKERETTHLAEIRHKPWLRASEDFTSAPELGRPKEGNSPVIHFFRKQATGSVWIAKLGEVPLRNEVLINAALQSSSFLGVYADEILEKLALALYQLLGTQTPTTALSYQPVTKEGMHTDFLLHMQLDAKEQGRLFELPPSPRMHFMSKFIKDFRRLDEDFLELYPVLAKQCGNEHVQILTSEGEYMPLKGLGSMLAAADFLYDCDCLGNSCGNAGYVIREDRARGERYAQLVKIDAGYAFSYSELRFDKEHNPRDRTVAVAPNKLSLQFADLAPADQREFAATAKRILATPYEEFANLFSQTQELKEGLAAHHWQQLLDELIARKSLFLKAFAPETDRSIVKEIEAAQAKVAKKLDHTEEVSAQAVEELLAQEKEETVALAELRVRLAVVDVKESQSEKAGKCKTFQLPSTNTHFVGREEAMAEVLTQLNRANGSVIGQSISGIGGVGKTQLALHFAQAAANGEAVGGRYLGYDYVVWLNAEVFLEGQFQAMAEVWIGEHLKADEAVETVYRYLRGKRTLLVFDNAENARAIAAFLPPTHYASPVHFLITSRSAEWGGLPTVKLGGFTLKEAQEYVEHHLGPQSKEGVGRLVELLGGLPLAMSQAVSYIKAGHSTLEGFEEQFYLNQASLLSHELLEEEDHPKTVGTTLTLCLAQAKVKSPLVEKLLGVVAYFAAEGIKVELVERALEESKEEIEQALEVLESYSLVSRGSGGLQVHRLVQEVIRYRHRFLKEPHRYWNRVVELLRDVVFDDETNIEGMKQCSHAIVHVKRIGELSKKAGLSQEEELKLADLLEVSGLHQQTLGNYEVARALQEQALEIREQHHGPGHVQVARTLVNLGVAYGDLGDARKQKELLERALLIQETHYSPDHVQEARALVNLGNAYGALGDARKQKELLERSLLIQETHYGHDHVQVARTLGYLGNAHGALGDARKQKELLERALRIKETHYGPDHVQVARTLEDLGVAYGALGDARKKKELLERALPINKIYYGADHVEVASTLVNLGNAYGELGDALKKKELLERALRIEEAHYGADHVEVASTLGNLGVAYGELGDARKKKELLERTLPINETYYGADHVEVAITLVNLGNAYGDLGDARKKKELLERALPINETYYGADHVEVAITLVNLGNAYGDLGDAYKKKELLERALRIFETHYGPDHVQVATTLFNLACACLALGEVSGAKNYAQKMYTIFREYYGESHSNTQKAKALLHKCEEVMLSDNSLIQQYPSEVHSRRLQGVERITTPMSQPIETDLEMVEIVIGWVEILERKIKRWDTASLDNSSASIFVGMALEIIRTGHWEQLLKSPTNYGMPEEVVAELAMYRDVPRLVGQIERYAQLIDKLSASLLSSGSVNALKELVGAFQIE